MGGAKYALELTGRLLNTRPIGIGHTSKNWEMVGYVAVLLGFPVAEVPPEILELKLTHILLKREIKKMQVSQAIQYVIKIIEKTLTAKVQAALKLNSKYWEK